MRALSNVLCLVAFLGLPFATADDAKQTKDSAPVVATRPAQHWRSEKMVKLVPLQHADAGTVRQALRALCPILNGVPPAESGVTVEPLGAGVILSGQPEAIDVAMEAIRLLDAPNARGLETRFITLKAARAHTVEPILRGILDQNCRARNKEDMPGIVTDPRTETLIVTATPRDMQFVNEILAKLDVEGPSSPPPERRSEAQFDMTVFQAVVPRDQIVGMQAARLADKAQTCESLQAALSSMGRTKTLYRAEQTITLGEETKLTMGSQAPFVRGTQVSNTGAVTSQVEYEKLGCTATVKGVWQDEPSDRGEATVDIEMKALADSDVEIGNGVKAPVFRAITEKFAGSIKAGQPLIL
ncbi:MAG TPA: secretin N-terminal domain-containing protein, partial [Phycisphaerae bacterium]|nr:secretin N-terminal domain-containing protein [Phycisphaerae bacterium]